MVEHSSEILTSEEKTPPRFVDIASGRPEREIIHAAGHSWANEAR